MNVFGFKTNKFKKKNTQIVGQKGGCSKTSFFNLCFANCEKLAFFLGPSLGKFWLMFKKHYT